MALGGGYFTTQNKVIPGSYINMSAPSTSGVVLADRGTVAIALATKWGKSGITVVDTEVLTKSILKTFGYPYEATENKTFREILLHAKKILVYRLDDGGNKASCTYATAKYKGTRGNDLKIVIAVNVDDESKFDVSTVLGTEIVDKQTVATASELVNNDFVDFITSASLTETSGTSLSGGTDSTPTGTTHSAFLDALESEDFNILTTLTSDATIKSLYVAYTKRMIEEVGKKFQTVLYDTPSDHEGIINVITSADLVPWVSGAEAGCEINRTCTNMRYDGEVTITDSSTQAQLETYVREGKFAFHKVGSDYRVLRDINSLVTVTADKGEDFKQNQIIRVIYSMMTGFATLFNNSYLGNTPNDEAGRIAFWSDCVDFLKTLRSMRAINDFVPTEDVIVEMGETANSIFVTVNVAKLLAMEIMYMAIYVR